MKSMKLNIRRVSRGEKQTWLKKVKTTPRTRGCGGRKNGHE
jgi:hypothetical protein